MLLLRCGIVVRLLPNGVTRHQHILRISSRTVVTCADTSIDYLRRGVVPALGQAMACDEPAGFERSEFSNSHNCSKSDILHRFDWITDHGPCIPVSGKNIKVLNEPHDFYTCLKDLAEGATQRIVLASLYLGTGPMERDLVDCVHRAAVRSSSLRINILLDYMRGSRETNSGASSRSMLLDLIRQYKQRASVALYHTPDLRGVVRHLLPQRYNETFGVSHLKVYLFDDTLIMSGANLSESYFTNRQDRYIKISDCRPLGDYYERLVSAVTSLSFHLQPDGDVQLIDFKHGHPYEDSDSSRRYRQEMRRRIERVIHPRSGVSKNDDAPHNSTSISGGGVYHTDVIVNGHSAIRPNYTASASSHTSKVTQKSSLPRKSLSKNLSDSSLSSVDLLDDSTEWNVASTTTILPLSSSSPHLAKYQNVDLKSENKSDSLSSRSSSSFSETDEITATLLQSSEYITTASPLSEKLTAATRLQSSRDITTETSEKLSDTTILPNNRDTTSVHSSLQDADTLIFPLVQMGPFGITQDELVTQTLMRSAEEDTKIYLASGYFNLTTKYMRCIIDECRAVFEMLTAAPQANGFYGAQGISGAIPDVYTYIAHQFYDTVSLANQRQRIRLYEYSRPGWTVHTKGLWYYVNGETLPYLTAIGSPNFGYRSVYRDLECQMLIISRDESLRRQLHEERQRLYSGSELVSDRTFSQPERRVPTWVSMVTPFIKNFF